MRDLKKKLKNEGNESIVDSVQFRENFKLLKKDTIAIDKVKQVNIDEIQDNVDKVF